MPYDMGNVPGDPVPWFRSALEHGRTLVQGIRADQWDAPTPCSEWNVRELVHHLVSNNVWYADGMSGESGDDEPPPGDILGSEPLAAYAASVDAVAASMLTEGAMDRVLSFWGGVTGKLFTAEHFVDCFIHGWDLAQATEQGTALSPDLVEHAYAILEPGNGQPDVAEVWDFTDVGAPEGAELQTRLLARAGRVA